MSGSEAARLLRDRADIYGRDAERLLHEEGHCDDVAILTTIRDELRKVADAVAS